MADDPLLARMNAALRRAEALRAEALRVQQEAAARASEVRHASARLRETMDRGIVLRPAPRARIGRNDPA